ncbi:hypothetical protein SAMN06272737_1494 [Blastococcus mobilis]|uniref:Uncharacterized protein n=1 Tax=Blastococcus mobilis TaxID=1938746 RepID=A0A239AME0_9ACTN|nr:hypothetical protein SAMN06272737_1494 [Blastococcus mobilis]
MTASRPIESVYLSGWEYNRLLQDDPTQPRNSAISAATFWAGAHQLWLFKRVYCSRESYENETEATDRLGWFTGDVLRDLYYDEALQISDWTNLPPPVAQDLRAAHHDATKIFSPNVIRRAIRTGDANTLEASKLMLLGPLLRHYSCLESGAPNSVNNWIQPRRSRRPLWQFHLQNLAAPVMAGLQLCRPPGTGVSREAQNRQKHVQETVEGPMIVDLLSGEGEYSGARGYEPYFRRLLPVREAYEPINDQLRHDWLTQRDTLRRLREAADQHLWADLHGQWLPALVTGNKDAARDFDRWIRTAMRLRPIAGLLNSNPVTTIVGTVSTSAATALLTKAGVPLPDALVGTLATVTGVVLGASRLRKSLGLAVFYQKTM